MVEEVVEEYWWKRITRRKINGPSGHKHDERPDH